MAPMLLEHPSQETFSDKSFPICSDPSVVVSEHASRRTKDLWWLHGHPHSTRYSNPKLTSFGALIRYDASVYRGQKAFLYPSSDNASAPYHSMTWDDFDRVTDVIALTYARLLREELEEANHSQKQPTIALLGRGVTLDYFCTQLALQKLGIRVLLLAEANALAAIHHLITKCQAVAVITDSKNASVDTQDVRKINLIEDLPSEMDINVEELDKLKFQDFGDVWERHNFIIHSSGSTGMPKPIIHTNRSMMLIARMYRLFQEFDIENWFLLFPLYHIAGISVALSNLPNGQILSFPPISWPPSSSSLLSSWETLASMGHPVECVHCAPTLIENMVEYIEENGGDFSPLVSLKILQPGGAPLSDNLVKTLVNAGVNVKTTYGSTEIGPPFRTIPHSRSSTKCYSFRNLYPDSPYVKMEKVGPGIYECIVYKGFELAAELWEGKPDNEPYRTNDLFIQDPPGSGNFVFQGRQDDVLAHSNGEKTNGAALQLDIQSASKILHKVLAVGRSKPCVGLLVEIHPDYDPESEATIQAVWKATQKINPLYPKHSQVTQSMIKILPRGSTLPVTPKGNVKRKAAEALYEQLISQLYSDITALFTSNSSLASLPEFIRSTLSSLTAIPRSQIEDHMTFYELGIDSRLALSLRTSLSSHLFIPISLNMIFENPTIAKLVPALTAIKSRAANPHEKKGISENIIQTLISKHEADLRDWPLRAADRSFPTADKEVVLLTGATGTVGTALLEVFATAPSVGKIYTMIRGPNPLARLRTSLEGRGLDPSILDGGKVEAINFCMRDPLLGLDVDTYHKLANEVTIMVQNAWKMDFNLLVEDFEDDCLFNTMALLRFAHAGRPKTLSFTSSISTCMGPGQISPTVPELPIGPSCSVTLPNGYAQSKFIVERITQTASKELGVRIKLLRIGQLCGHTRTGKWSADEMWPILLATSAHKDMRCIPTFEGKAVDWVPVDIAARAISELLLENQEEEKYSVHNITNPEPIPWMALVEMFKRSLASTPSKSASTQSQQDLELIPMTEWVKKLNALAEGGADVPGLRLLGFFEEMAKEKGKSKFFETQKTTKLSKSLKECQPFQEEWMGGNVRAWRGCGFLS